MACWTILYLNIAKNVIKLIKTMNSKEQIKRNKKMREELIPLLLENQKKSKGLKKKIADIRAKVAKKYKYSMEHTYDDDVLPAVLWKTIKADADVSN